MGKITLTAAIVICLSFTAHSAVVMDMLGRRVDVPDKKIERIIALRHSMSFISYLGAQGMVTAVERIDKKDYEKRPYVFANKEIVKNLPVISEGGAKGIPSNEMMIALKPDVIFTVTQDASEADLMQRKLRIPVVVLSYGYSGVEFSDIYRSLELAGKILNREQRAAELISYMEGLKKELDFKPDKRARAYIGGVSYKGTRGIDSTEANFLPFRLAGVENTADSAGLKGHVFLQKEYLTLMNPDIIFIDSAGFELVAGSHAKDSGLLKRLKAFSRGQAYLLPANTYYYTNIDLMLANAFFIAKIAYPDRYKNLDPDRKAGEIIKAFTGKDIFPEVKKDMGGFQRLRLADREIKAEVIR